MRGSQPTVADDPDVLCRCALSRTSVSAQVLFSLFRPPDPQQAFTANLDLPKVRYPRRFALGTFLPTSPLRELDSDGCRSPRRSTLSHPRQNLSPLNLWPSFFFFSSEDACIISPCREHFCRILLTTRSVVPGAIGVFAV